MKPLTPMIFLITVTMGTVAYSAEPGKSAFTDPREAGPDFAIQGEYEGQVETDEGAKTFGAHVIALGEGKFHLVGYPGGLPGNGWSRGDGKHEHDGEMRGDKAVFQADVVTLEVDGGRLNVIDDGETIGSLEKVHRKSPTLEAKPPAGAIVLFDGSSADHFENGKVVHGNLLGATNCSSKEKFHDHTLHLEFRTPFMPTLRGQHRGNSGVYIQSRYECQVLDSFGLEGKNNECGGFYSVAEPKLNMCYPPLSWQTFDIDFQTARYDDNGKKIKNARVTVRHNGVVIHDELELPKHTPGRHEEGPEPAGLFLQDHGNPVAYRNIWVVKK